MEGRVKVLFHLPDNLIHLPILLFLLGYLSSHQVRVDHRARLNGGAAPWAGYNTCKQNNNKIYTPEGKVVSKFQIPPMTILQQGM